MEFHASKPDYARRRHNILMFVSTNPNDRLCYEQLVLSLYHIVSGASIVRKRITVDVRYNSLDHILVNQVLDLVF